MRYITTIITLLFLILAIDLYGQVSKRRNYFPIWTYHQSDINIHGVSIGLWSLGSDSRHTNTNTNGVKLELLGLGILVPIIPHSPIVESDSEFVALKKEPLSERINGLNLSSFGSVCNCETNGVTAGLIAQINRQVNGISASLIMNFNQGHNGIMIAMFNDAYYMNGLQIGVGNNGYKTNGIQIGIIGNSAKEMKGIQIGLINYTKKLKGIQIGLWNVNEKRKLPFINWNFK